MTHGYSGERMDRMTMRRCNNRNKRRKIIRKIDSNREMLDLQKRHELLQINQMIVEL